MKYRKKPVVIDAIQNSGEWKPIVEWLQSFHSHGLIFQPGQLPPIIRDESGALAINTLEGVMRAEVGDWVIRGVKGEFYPVKPEIFDATYEPVRE